MLPIFSFKDDSRTCVTRVRYSPLADDVFALGIDSGGYVRLMDLEAQKSAKYLYYEHLFLKDDVYMPHLCDFSFNSSGRYIYVASSDGCISISSLNMIGNHLNKKKQLLTLSDAHVGGTFCVYPSKSYDFIIFTGGGDGYIKQWDLRLLSNRNIYNINVDNKSKSKQWSKPLVSLWAHVTAVSSLSFKVDKHFLSCGIDENIRIWSYDYFNAVETIDSDCDNLGVWDMVTNRDKVIVIGKYGDAWAFSLDYFNKSNCRDIKRFNLMDGINNDGSLFSTWRRICTYSHYVVIPTINNKDKIKAHVIDLNNGNFVDSLVYNDRNYPYNIASIDAHPNPNIGLILTGG